MNRATECSALIEGDTLIVGNGLIERRWRIREGQLYALSLRTPAREWLIGEADTASLAFGRTAPATVELRTEVSRDHGVEAESLKAILTAGPRTYVIKIFANLAAIGMRLVLSEDGLGQTTGSDGDSPGPSGIETDQPAAAPEIDPHDVIDAFTFDFHHCWLTETRFTEQTDSHNNLVFENRWSLHTSEARIKLSGNLFYLEHRPSRCGMAMLKLAPSPQARPVRCDADLELQRQRLLLRGHGIDGAGDGYEQWVVAYEIGHFDRVAAIQALQQKLRPYEPGRDGVILSNTWGDRSRDAAISESFLLREIEAGSEMGVDVAQIDDGWQAGISSNSAQRAMGGLWSGFWGADPRFWTPHPQRFPNGLEPVLHAARAAGMQLGLWYVPDSSNDYVNWERDAGHLLGMWRQWGVRHVKIDGVAMRSKRAEQRLGQFYEQVLTQSDGAIAFDADVTAGVRPGFWGHPHVGATFVENRYTDWHNYWPHHTLRNLWRLAHHVHPVRLRMEFLNNNRNHDKYQDDPLAPRFYSAAALFAMVMMSSPLAWMEVSNLPARDRHAVAALARVWKQHRDAIYSSAIVPIGGEPDGYTWSGFVTHGHARAAYAVVYRPLGDADTFEFDLPRADARHIEWLSGDGRAQPEGTTVRVRIDHPLEYGFFRIVFG